jgi:hypothetical protein
VNALGWILLALALLALADVVGEKCANRKGFAADTLRGLGELIGAAIEGVWTLAGALFWIVVAIALALWVLKVLWALV